MQTNIVKFFGLVIIVSGIFINFSSPVFASDEILAKFKSLILTTENTHNATAATALDTALKTILPSKILTPECPPVLMHKCHFISPAHQLNNLNNKIDYGNYDTANRPYGGFITQPNKKMPITSIIIHSTEGSLESVIKTFQDHSSYTSSHYIIDADGQIYQMIRTKDVAWHAGNWYTNIHSIGIEHVGHAINGNKEFTPEMYKSSVMLVRYLAFRFNFPLDHTHIIGHDNVPAPTQSLVADLHYDPGPFWNWQLFFSDNRASKGALLTIIKPFVTDPKTPVMNCPNDIDETCTTLPAQPTNFVYLHTEPNDKAPLISDASLHPDGSAGTSNIKDWSAKAVYGQQFVIAEEKDEWTAIWYGGQKAWFFNPDQKLNAKQTNGQYITPRHGLENISVYGTAYPEAEAYPETQVPVQSMVPLDYKIAEGQKYSITKNSKNGYLQIQFNHRVAYVDQADVHIEEQ